MKRQHLIFGLVHCVIWIGALVAVERLLRGSPASSAYALICAWWATLYGASVLETTWRATAVFLLGMIVALTIDTIAMWGLLYHDTPPPASAGFIGVVGLLCVLWVSPFLVNAGVMWIRNRIRR